MLKTGVETVIIRRFCEYPNSLLHTQQYHNTSWKEFSDLTIKHTGE